MNKFLEQIILRSRTIILVLFALFIAGIVSYFHMPKEANPDIPIPFIFVSTGLPGISPEDAERLLIKPLEKELRNIEGLKEMTSTASEGNASVTLEFQAGFDVDKALDRVREKVDLARPSLPDNADEPKIKEINLSHIPVLVVGLSGDIAQRSLLKFAGQLKSRLKTEPQILDVNIIGDRDEVIDIDIEPCMLETYGIDFKELVGLITFNNKLVPAGTLDTGVGRIPFKVPGLLETSHDIFNLPIKVVDDRVIKLSDIACLRKAYADPQKFARINGHSAISLEISKRTGKNVIETVAAIKRIVNEEAQSWPAGVQVTFSRDMSREIKDMLLDLQNNLISAVVLVMVVIIAALGLRTSLLVGISIPGSFLAGLFLLHLMGITVNIVVLFSLILVVGMLVDGAIIVTEFADRKMAQGVPPTRAYILAAQRMAWPIISSITTTLAAFAPLLFWPGIVGQFMKFLPITLITTLSASLVMALIFVPTLGGMFGKAPDLKGSAIKSLDRSEEGNLEDLRGMAGFYIRVLQKALSCPGKVVIGACVVLVGVYALYAFCGKGIEFFPNVEPEFATINVRAQGNLSVYEMDSLVKEVERELFDIDGFATIYAQSGLHVGQGADTIGMINLEFKPWDQRRKARDILNEVRLKTKDISGIIIEIQEEKGGPVVGKPIDIQLSSQYPELLEPAVKTILGKLKTMPTLKDIDDTRSLPGFEWRLAIDREKASQFGVNVALAGDVIQLITTGLKVDKYRPVDSDDEVDIRIRYPLGQRHLYQAGSLMIPTVCGMIPLNNFTEQYPGRKVSEIARTDGKRALAVRADVKDGFLPNDQVKEIEAWLVNEAELDSRINVKFKGEDEEQKAASKFLVQAFFIALAAMAIILVTQFNSFYNTLLILTAVIFSTIGVLLGLLITGQPFGIVMNGIGIIALAGIVVTNNIVLIDTYLLNQKSGMQPLEAILKTCAQRLRPIFLTTITTILGLLPMVFKLNIDFIHRTISYGAPSTQWWSQLATAVAFGLAFATVLTLVLTPSLLILGERVSNRFLKKSKV